VDSLVADSEPVDAARLFIRLAYMLKERISSGERLPIVLTDERFYEAPSGARHGWVCMHADGRIDWGEVAGLLRESYRQVALKRMFVALEEAIGAPGADQRPPGKRKRRKTDCLA
jgi:hypothetical protein